MEWWQWIGPVSALVLGARVAWDAVRDWREGDTVAEIADEASIAVVMLISSFVAMDAFGAVLISTLSLTCAFMPERWRKMSLPLISRKEKQQLPEEDRERLHD